MLTRPEVLSALWSLLVLTYLVSTAAACILIFACPGETHETAEFLAEKSCKLLIPVSVLSGVCIIVAFIVTKIAGI